METGKNREGQRVEAQEKIAQKEKDREVYLQLMQEAGE